MASSDAKIDLIRSVSLFEGLARRELAEIAQLLDEVDVPVGRILMRQGEVGNEMYVVVSGLFKIERDGRHIRDVGPGASLGDMSLIAEGPRTATVTAIEPARALVAGHREFHTLMDLHPTIKMKILEGLATKIRWLDQSAAH